MRNKVFPALIIFMLPLLCIGQKNGTYADSVASGYVGKVPRSLVLKTNFLPIFAGQIILTGEYRLLGEMVVGRRQSISLGASYLGKGVLYSLAEKSSGATKSKISGYRVQGAYKLYLTPWHQRPAGFYIGPHASWSKATVSYPQNPGNYISIRYFNVNLLAGVQFFVHDRISADIFMGPGYKDNFWREYNASSLSRPYVDADMGLMTRMHFKFNLGFNIGIAL